MEQAHAEIIIALMAEKIRQLQDELFLCQMELKMLKRENAGLPAPHAENGSPQNEANKGEQTFAFSGGYHE